MPYYSLNKCNQSLRLYYKSKHELDLCDTLHGHRYTHFPNMNRKVFLLSHLCILKLPNLQKLPFKKILVSFRTEQWVFAEGWAAGSLLLQCCVQCIQLRVKATPHGQNSKDLQWWNHNSLGNTSHYKHDHAHEIQLEILCLSLLKCLIKELFPHYII